MMLAAAIHEAAQLGPLERLEALCDRGSIQVVRSRVSSPHPVARSVAGDGVVGAADIYADEHLRADSAAAAGFVDEIVSPADTCERLSWALLTLSGHRS